MWETVNSAREWMRSGVHAICGGEAAMVSIAAAESTPARK
jgi:hypothetical protein